jgi:Uncharacterized protein conserved in bacteria (DUF2188)
MKSGGGVHTVPSVAGNGWSNKLDGRAISQHRTKQLAVEAGRETARRLKVEHTIHLSDGKIGEKNSYGNDPFPPKDSK